MAYSITTAKGDLEGVLHGTTLDQVSNINGVFNRAARQLLMDIDPQETKRIVSVGQIFDQVYDYSFVNADVKGNKIIDLRPQLDRILLDNPRQSYSKPFDLNKKYETGPSFTVDFNSSTKTLKVNYPMLNTGTILNNADSLAGNGTWTVGGSATNLRLDSSLMLVNSGSIEFDLPAAGSTGYVEVTLPTSIDLSSHFNQSYLFYYLYAVGFSHITSASIRWGSSSSNYYQLTSTNTFQGNAFNDGWDLMSGQWKDATVVGTPDKTKINYIRITVNYDGTAITGVHLNEIVSRLGKMMDLVYYSKYLFRNNANVWYESIPSGTDESLVYVNLDTESYNIYLDQVALLCIQQSLGQVATLDIQFFAQRYADGVARYRDLYKSEIIQPRNIYYRQDKATYRRFWGRNFNY